MRFGLLTLGDHLPDPATGALTSQHARFGSIVESAVRAEAHGFGVVAIGEHHFNEYIVSVPQLLLASIAARTTDIRLATAVTLLATTDPVRVAEDFATLDVLSGGRVELVVGRGIARDAYDQFGYDFESSREIFDEHLALLLSIWSSEEPISWKGVHRPPLDHARVEPRPLQRPRPPVWVGAGLSEESVRRAAGAGLPLMLPSIFRKPDDYVGLVKLYRDLMADYGNEQLIRIGCASHVHVASTGIEAYERWKPYVLQYATFANRVRGVDAGIDYDRVIDGPAICGGPDEVVERIARMHDMLEPDVHLLMFDLGGIPSALLLETIDLFGNVVMPQLDVPAIVGERSG